MSFELRLIERISRILQVGHESWPSDGIINTPPDGASCNVNLIYTKKAKWN